MKLKQSAIIVVAIGFVLLGYNNCSGVGFTSNDASGKVGDQSTPGPNPNPNPNPTPTPTPKPPDPTVPEVVKNCNDAVAAGTIKTLNDTIDFADTKLESGRNQVCEFDVNNNLSMRDSFMRARYEQYKTLNLPANAVLCDVKMTVAQQQFKYDDIFFLTFNGRILGTDNKSSMSMKLTADSMELATNGQMVPLYKYDWLALRDAPFQNVADDYCLGKDQASGSCMWPVTEQQGNIVFQFDQKLLIAIGLKVPANQQNFGFIMTGDNDPNLDCYHSDLKFDMQVQYYLK